jgi:hypothetical protein
MIKKTQSFFTAVVISTAIGVAITIYYGFHETDIKEEKRTIEITIQPSV